MHYFILKKLKLFLLLAIFLVGSGLVSLRAADRQNYPNWLYAVYHAQERDGVKRQLQYYFNPTTKEDVYKSRNARIEAYIKTCYDAFINAPDRGLYPFIKARREMLQLAADRGGFFSPYAVVASRPEDLALLEKESVKFLERVLRLDFDEKTDVSGLFYEIGNTVYVEYEAFGAQDRLVRLTIDAGEKTIDICRNDCPRPWEVMTDENN